MTEHLRGATAEEDMTIDTAVHRAIYGATHNHFLEETATQYHNLAMRIWHLFTDRLTNLSEHVEEHRDLLTAIGDGDPDRARVLAAAHVRSFERAVRHLI